MAFYCTIFVHNAQAAPILSREQYLTEVKVLKSIPTITTTITTNPTTTTTTIKANANLLKLQTKLFLLLVPKNPSIFPVHLKQRNPFYSKQAPQRNQRPRRHLLSFLGTQKTAFPANLAPFSSVVIEDSINISNFGKYDSYENSEMSAQQNENRKPIDASKIRIFRCNNEMIFDNIRKQLVFSLQYIENLFGDYVSEIINFFLFSYIKKI